MKTRKEDKINNNTRLRFIMVPFVLTDGRRNDLSGQSIMSDDHTALQGGEVWRLKA